MACTKTGRAVRPSVSSSATRAPRVQPVDCPALESPAGASAPLWETAFRRGLVYGSSTATWQISDESYRRLYTKEAAILFTEDDLLWYRVRPTPTSGLKFKYGDQIVGFARDRGMLVFGAHLVWDDGFGNGWKHKDLWGMSPKRAHDVLFGTVQALVHRYRGRVTAWSTVNEAIDGAGLRQDVPWYATIGSSYVAQSFQVAHEADPDALLVLNDYGFETDDDVTAAADKRAAMLRVLDRLLGAGVPVHAVGVQAHLDASRFPDGFDATAYRKFLADVADRKLKILITELDVLDDGLPADIPARDRAVADVYRRYLDAAMEEPAVVALMTFGLSDRYTWLQEDFPRQDGAPRRPLPFDDHLKPTPAYDALAAGLQEATPRTAFWQPPRCS